MINNYSNQLEKEILTLNPGEIRTIAPKEVLRLGFTKGDYNLSVIYLGEDRSERTIPMGPMDERALETELEVLKTRVKEYKVSLAN